MRQSTLSAELENHRKLFPTLQMLSSCCLFDNYFNFPGHLQQEPPSISAPEATMNFRKEMPLRGCDLLQSVSVVDYKVIFASVEGEHLLYPKTITVKALKQKSISHVSRSNCLAAVQSPSAHSASTPHTTHTRILIYSLLMLLSGATVWAKVLFSAQCQNTHHTHTPIDHIRHLLMLSIVKMQRTVTVLFQNKVKESCLWLCLIWNEYSCVW